MLGKCHVELFKSKKCCKRTYSCYEASFLKKSSSANHSGLAYICWEMRYNKIPSINNGDIHLYDQAKGVPNCQFQ